MNYITCINALLKEEILKAPKAVLFGQNVSAGSCISGMCKGLTVQDGGRIINTQNSENTLVGVGFGLMLSGVSSVFFVKQLDFLLLGIDQLVNTHNVVRVMGPTASFCIMAIVVDSGYEGAQSSCNNLPDVCSFSGIQGYTLTNFRDAEAVLKNKMFAPGFRIITLSQRLFKQEVLFKDRDLVAMMEDCTLFQYISGEDATIVAFNNMFPQALELHETMEDKGIAASLFSVCSAIPVDWSLILKDVAKTKNLVVLDDTKSLNTPSHSFLYQAVKTIELKDHQFIQRTLSDDWYVPSSHVIDIDYEAVIARVKKHL